jgi:hypothetical protein
MKRTYWLGALAYLVVTFPFAFVWHLVLFKNVYDRLGIFNREEPIVALGFVAILVQGLLLSYAFGRFRQRSSSLKEGLKFGLIAGVLLWSSQVIAAAAKHEVSSLPTWLALETAYFALQFALVGVALGWIYRRTPGRHADAV